MTERISLLDHLANVAGCCREAQRAYFRTRSNEHLRASKALEAELDKLLAQRAAEAVGVKQSSFLDTTSQPEPSP